MTEPSPYLVIAENLRVRIASGELAPGERLPSVAQLGIEYDVSPSVGARAYQLLASEGLITARQGAGTYVRGPQDSLTLIRRHRVDPEGSPFAADAAAQGSTGTWSPESTTARATDDVAERLDITPGAPVMRTDYVYRIDDQAVQLATSWEPLAITGDSLIALPELGPYAGIGVAARMHAIGIAVALPTEVVRARMCTRAEAQQLGITPGVAVLAITRTYYDQDTGRPVETADIVLLGDRWAAQYGPGRPS